MRNKSMVITAILLMAAIFNYSRLSDTSLVRGVEFLSIFAIGALSAALFMQFVKMKKGKH